MSDFPNNDHFLTGESEPWPSADDSDEDWQIRVERELAADFPEFDVGYFPYQYGQKETGSHWGAQCHGCGATMKESGPIKLRNAIHRHVAAKRRTA
jgi:hypothetical protein